VKSELDIGSDMQQLQLGVKCPVGLMPPCLHFSVHPVELLEWLLG
jgi:hypothetical protein